MLAVFRFVFCFCAFVFFLVNIACSQTNDTSAVAEEDYSSYGSPTESVQYCTQKVRRLSPTKLLSLGYEWQNGGSYQPGPPTQGASPAIYYQPEKIRSVYGARFAASAPVISNTRMILNLGANYYESKFRMEKPDGNSWVPAHNLLDDGMRTVGVSATLFKPWNARRFSIAFVQTDWSGNYTWSTLKERFPNPTFTFAGFYGWKPNENFMWALGFTQSWRGGGIAYFPLLFLNYTINDKWGLEILAPARAHVRYNFSVRSLLMLGYEIEGNSYQMHLSENTSGQTNTYNQLELRRSELKPRLIYEQQLYGFIWLSAQVGYRVSANFNLSESRNDGRNEYAYQAEKFGEGIGSAFYANFSINLVSP